MKLTEKEMEEKYGEAFSAWLKSRLKPKRKGKSKKVTRSYRDYCR